MSNLEQAILANVEKQPRTLYELAELLGGHPMQSELSQTLEQLQIENKIVMAVEHPEKPLMSAVVVRATSSPLTPVTEPKQNLSSSKPLKLF